jgi:hypothetical protein
MLRERMELDYHYKRENKSNNDNCKHKETIMDLNRPYSSWTLKSGLR